MRFSKMRPEREDVAQLEYPTNGFIPYKGYWNDKTLLTHGNDLIQIVKISGFSFETADDEDLDIKKDLRNLLFKGMSDGGVELYFHIVRRQEQLYADDYVSLDMPDGFATYLDQKWAEKNRYKKAFINELYISVIKTPSSTGALSGIEDVVKAVIRTADHEAWQIAMNESYEALEEATGRVVNSLRQYSAQILQVVQTKDGSYSEIAEFLYRVINCGESTKCMLSPLPLASQLVSHRLYFGAKAIELKKQDGSVKYAGMISMKEYGPKTWPGMLDQFLDMPFEFVITQSFDFINRQVAIGEMQLQQNRMIQAGDKAVSQIYEIGIALDKAMSGEIGFGKHHLTVMCMSNNIKELESILSIAAVEVTNMGGIGVRERVNMEPAFWGQLPGNKDFIVRQSTINTQNLASMNSLHNFPVGQPKNNHWGDSVTVFDTTSGTPFYFNFHVRDVGHTMIIGPTGAGKTVLMNFLCAQAQKYKCRLFFFDKDRGAQIFIKALSGNYTIIDPSKPCGFNPLQLPDTGENRTFLLDWLKLLVTTHGEVITSDDVAALSNAVSGNYKLEQRDRKLSNIAPFLGIGGPGTLAGRLAMWYGNGSHAKVFDNDQDVIDFAKASVFGFEMAELLKDYASLNPALSYIFHRISISLDGTPTMIVLDEAWALIDNPVFAPRIRDWLKVLRKLNTFVVFATQSVEDATKSEISDTLVQQTATQIFLPNLKATDVYRKVFMLSEREFRLIKTTDPSTRYFLLKQGNDSVVARVDLSGMTDVINILSGRANTVVILDEVIKQYGDDPSIWMPIFNKRVQETMEA
ncbi:MAG: VirB4 family type IV secretion/conjugal transfer ATPase [Alphaproteobacteria bacterium]